MKVWITGASGFIGRNLAEQLEQEFDLLAPGHAELDLLDEEAVASFLRASPVDAVVHCATKPGHRNAKDPAGLVYANTRMFHNIVRNETGYGRMILITSGAVYDQRFFAPKMAEPFFGTHVPVDETGYSKYLCARYAERLDNVVELRPFGVFGNYEDWEIRFISNAICKTLFDLPVTLRQNRRFDYLWVDDLVRIVRHFLLAEPAHRAYNVTPDEAVELKTLAEMVVRISGKELPVRIAQPGLGVEYSGDNRRLKAEVPGFPFTPLEHAVRSLYAWYAEHRHLIRRELLLVDK
ncbi:MAG: NAD(P)-dependent oxidoreductase [Acidobacteriota bacterium]